MSMKISIVAATIIGGGLATGGAAVMATASATSSGTMLTANQAKAITITGKLVDPDGKPAAKIPIQLMLRERRGGSGGSGPGDQKPELLVTSLQSAQDRANRGFKPVGKAVSDESGQFTFKNVRETGSLRLMIGNQDRTLWAMHSVYNPPDAGKDVDVGEIKLNKPLSGEQPGQGGGERKPQ